MNLRIAFGDETYLSIPVEGDEPEEDTYVEPKFAKLATGRPDRETVINDDDCLNLQISLGLANTVEELLEMI